MDLAFLAAVLAAAVFLRFYRLKERGILLWDDGLRMREVLFVHDLLVFLKARFKDILSKKADLNEAARNFRGRFLFENPLNIFMYTFTSFLTKDIENSGLLTNGMFALLGILGVYFTGAVLISPGVGLAGAFFLTLSGYHLMYSRSVHAEVTSGAFYIWGTLFYWLSHLAPPSGNAAYAWLFLAGVCGGSAFCANARQFHIPPLFVAFEIVRQFYAPGLLFPRLVILGSGLFLPFFLINQFLSALKEMGYPYWTFLKQIYERSGHLSAPDFLFRSGAQYFKTILQCDGPFFILWALIGAAVLARQKSFESVILLSEMWLPLLLWSSRSPYPKEVRESSMGTYQYPVPRLISSFIYSAVLLAAAGLLSLPAHFILPGLALSAVPALFILPKIMRSRSGFKKAVDFICGNSDGRHFTNVFEVSAFYVGNDKAFNIYALKKEEVESLYREKNVRHFLFVPSIHANSCREVPVPPFESVVSKTKAGFSVEVGTPEFGPAMVDDHNHLSPKIFRPNPIEVYDLKEYFNGH